MSILHFDDVDPAPKYKHPGANMICPENDSGNLFSYKWKHHWPHQSISVCNNYNQTGQRPCCKLPSKAIHLSEYSYFMTTNHWVNMGWQQMLAPVRPFTVCGNFFSKNGP